MLPDDVTERVALARAELRPETELGFHGHHNMAMGIANSLAAIEAGAERIDGSLAGPRRRRRQHAAGGVHRRAATAWAWRPASTCSSDGRGRGPRRADDGPPDPHRPRLADPRLRRRVLVVPAVCQARAEKYGVSSRDILVELGRRRTVGGQEDMIEDLALDMAKARGVI